MFNRQALAILAAYATIIPITLADTRQNPPMAFCKEGTCSDDDDGCPAQITTAGDGLRECKVYDTETVLSVGDFDAAEGGGYSVFLDVFEPDNGCAVLVKSPASTDEPGCGYVVGYFKNAVCTKMSLDKTFMIQHCCNGDCEKATGSPKMVRGLENRRSLGGRSVEIKGKDGRVVEPIEIGYPPQMRRSTAPTETFTEVQLAPRKDDADCKTYIPDGEVYTRPDNKTQIVAADVEGGTGDGQTTISTAREVSQSTTFGAGINFEIFSASTELTFEQSLTDTKEKSWTVPAGQSGNVGFTPTLKCTRGKLDCGEKPTGEACTGFRYDGENAEIAGKYAVIATS